MQIVTNVTIRHAMSAGHMWVFMSQLIGILMSFTPMALSYALHDLPTDLDQLSTIGGYSSQVITIYIKYVTISGLKIHGRPKIWHTCPVYVCHYWVFGSHIYQRTGCSNKYRCITKYDSPCQWQWFQWLPCTYYSIFFTFKSISLSDIEPFILQSLPCNKLLWKMLEKMNLHFL